MKKLLCFSLFFSLFEQSILPSQPSKTTLSETEQQKLNAQLFEAVKSKNVEKIKNLLQVGANVNAKNNYEETVLMNALKHATFEIVQMLLTWGADVNAQNNDKKTTLMVAIEHSGYLGNPENIGYMITAQSIRLVFIIKEFLNHGVKITNDEETNIMNNLFKKLPNDEEEFKKLKYLLGRKLGIAPGNTDSNAGINPDNNYNDLNYFKNLGNDNI